MIRLIQAGIIFMCTIMMMLEPQNTSEPMIVEAEPVIIQTSVEVKSEMIASTNVTKEIRFKTIHKDKTILSKDEIELIALLTMAEAEGECEYGKRLVIDTILNRMDSELSYFPDTISEVIYQKNAFTSLWNGRVNRCYVTEDIYCLVEEELENRTNHEVLYFCAGNYSKYGTPLWSVDNHYFSGE